MSAFRASPRALPPPPAGEYDFGFANLYLRTDEWNGRDGSLFVFVTLTIDGPDSSLTVSVLTLLSPVTNVS